MIPEKSPAFLSADDIEHPVENKLGYIVNVHGSIQSTANPAQHSVGLLEGYLEMFGRDLASNKGRVIERRNIGEFMKDNLSFPNIATSNL